MIIVFFKSIIMLIYCDKMNIYNMFKHYQLFIILSACGGPFLTGCRDYIYDIVVDTLPALTTDAQIYSLSASAIVTLINQSTSPIYITLVYDEAEKNSSGEWFLYSIITCSGGCPETTAARGHTVSAKSRFLNNPGTYRLVCTYGKKPRTPPEEKLTVYSNELIVR
jgi:hypothetical protein